MRTVLFYLADPSNETSLGWLFSFVSELRNTRNWTCTTPQLEQHSDASSCSAPDDLPIETVGFSVCLNPPSVPPDLSLEQGYFEDLLFIVNEVARISAATTTEWEVEVDGELVGTIELGAYDDGIRIGVLGGWNDMFGQP